MSEQEGYVSAFDLGVRARKIGTQFNNPYVSGESCSLHHAESFLAGFCAEDIRQQSALALARGISQEAVTCKEGLQVPPVRHNLLNTEPREVKDDPIYRGLQSLIESAKKLRDEPVEPVREGGE